MTLHPTWGAAVWMLGLLALGATSSPANEGVGPNILFVMSDDHAWQAVSAYGGTRNQTPRIDRIAKEGMRFDRCYVTNSICSPSRATILTGSYSHVNGVPDNFTDFDGAQWTFPKSFQSAGYQTALIGKWHLHTQPTGFDHWEILPGQGRYYRPEFLTEEGKKSYPGYVTDLITTKAGDWLRAAAASKQPFLLMVHHKAPHRPWEPAVRHLKRFDDTDISEPSTLFDDYRTRGRAAREAKMRIADLCPDSDLRLWNPDNEHRRWLYRLMSPEERATWEEVVDPRQSRLAGKSLTDRERVAAYYQLYIKDYLRCVEAIDEGVGTLLDLLDELDLTANTLVIYTSDQGFYLGEHGWFDKRFMYEESLRTPLLMRWPGVIPPGSINENLVSNVDFAATFLDAIAAAPPRSTQGYSLLPLARGETPAAWRSAFYYQYLEGIHRDHHVPKHEGVTTGEAKLIHFDTLNEWELYDLKRDPRELTNVYEHHEYATLRQRLHAELSRLRNELNVPPNTPE